MKCFLARRTVEEGVTAVASRCNDSGHPKSLSAPGSRRAFRDQRADDLQGLADHRARSHVRSATGSNKEAPQSTSKYSSTRHRELLPKPSPAIAATQSTQVSPGLIVAPPRNHHADQDIKGFGLPVEVLGAFRAHDVLSIEALTMLPVYQLVGMPELEMLTPENWSSLMGAFKKVHAPRRTRVATHNAEPNASLLALCLSARPFNCLVRAGILDVEMLAHCTVAELVNLDNFGAKCLEELLARLRAALEPGGIAFDVGISRASGQSDKMQAVVAPSSHANTHLVEASEPETDEFQLPPTVSLHEQLNNWFSRLNERQRDVVWWRYGLSDGCGLTLEEIGKRLDISRERVRQLESKSVRQLQLPASQRSISSLIAYLHQVVVAEGGLMTEAELGDALADISEVESIDPRGAVRVLLGISGPLIKVKGMAVWCLPDLHDLVLHIGSEAVGILSRAMAPISRSELLNRLWQTQYLGEPQDELYDKFLLACIHVNEKVVQRDDDSYGLAIWERHWQDDIVLALRRLDQPTHYAAIADAINATLQNGQQITARAVHVRLMQHPDIFVWVGRRGTYGLKERGIERAASYIDALTQILQDAGHPLTITEILAALHKVRPYYDESSVQITLGINDCFRAFPGSTFGLANLRDEDFAGAHYRVQRLFETGQAVTPRSARQEVVEALSTVDDFIAHIRGNHGR